MKESSIDAYRGDRMGVMKRNENPYQSVPPGKVPYGTTKCTFKLGLDNDGKLNRSGLGIKSKAFPVNPTDCISSSTVETKRAFQGLFDQMV